MVVRISTYAQVGGVGSVMTLYHCKSQVPVTEAVLKLIFSFGFLSITFKFWYTFIKSVFFKFSFSSMIVF